MAIYDILCEVTDERETTSGICKFNGFLEDYLSIIETMEDKKDDYVILSKLHEVDQNLKICVDLRMNMNKDAIANQIIRYRDSYKLPKWTIVCPYLVYGIFNEHQKAMILTVGDKEEYVIAKALYYVMSEPENEYEGTRNEIIALNANVEGVFTVVDSMLKFFVKNYKAGIVQRDLDAGLFINYEKMYTLAQAMAKNQLDHLKDILAHSGNKESTINQMIATWFLLKKFSYVQYMMDKVTLNRVYNGNVKQQRQVAKKKSDAIKFVSYSELWKLVKQLR